MRASVLVLVISVLMYGCASRFTTAQNAFISCTNSNPYNSYVDQNVVFIDQNSPNKYRLLSSTNKINQAQKDVFLKYLNFNSSCRKSFMANMGGGGYQVAYSSYYNQVDQIYSKLISGAITIGDANIQKQRAFEKLEYAFQNINQQIAAANERAYQQQLINDRQQQATFNQMINSIRGNQPTQTNCQKDGYGGMSCQSY